MYSMYEYTNTLYITIYKYIQYKYNLVHYTIYMYEGNCSNILS